MERWASRGKLAVVAAPFPTIPSVAFLDPLPISLAPSEARVPGDPRNQLRRIALGRLHRLPSESVPGTVYPKGHSWYVLRRTSLKVANRDTTEMISASQGPRCVGRAAARAGGV